MKILVTGATGFVGKALVPTLKERGHEVIAVSRQNKNGFIQVEDCFDENLWRQHLLGVDVVIHLAAKVHEMKPSPEQENEYFKYNTELTLKLASISRKLGVSKFVFLSSIKAVGESRPNAYLESEEPTPQDAYGKSKRDAEVGLKQFASESFSVFILRPPLVYGPNVKANFRALEKIVELGLPLPLGGLQGIRSLVYVGNLCDAIIKCSECTLREYHEFFVSDPEPISLPNLIRAIGKAKNKKVFLFNVPSIILKILLILVGKKNAFDRLNENLIVKMINIKNELNWKPPFTTIRGLTESYSQKDRD